MPISRLRLRLAAWFGAAFLIGLVILDVGFLLYTHRKADAKLTRDVTKDARDLSSGVIQERDANPAASAAASVAEVLGEWPPGVEVIAVYDAAGEILGHRGSPALVELLAPLARRERSGATDLAVDDEGALRAAWVHEGGRSPIVVVVGSSTAAIREDQERLIGWLLLSLPVIGLGAAGAGYALARRALTPVLAMARELDAVDPERIDRRLPVGEAPDELGQLALHFNGLLDRLAAARDSGRRFLAQAAHQLRTPLTIVRGESQLGLDRPRTAEEYRAALRRINLAADQMSRRVGELFLLAEAETGERPDVSLPVELDAVALEAADLMRGRAAALGRSLVFGVMDDVVVRGSESLLREAVLELLENACRHGTGGRPVLIAVRRLESRGRVEVANDGPPIPSTSEGLGLPIVRWVAEIHGAAVVVERADSCNTVALEFAASTSLPS